MFARRIVQLFSILRKGTWGLVPMLILLLYTYVGAVIFRALESPYELEKLNRSKGYHENLILDTVQRISNDNSNFSYVLEVLQEFRNAVANESYLKIIKISNNTGVFAFTDVSKWAVKEQTRWSIWGALYYAMTIYTTIGYGNIYPETWTGRFATVVYGLIGIPLALISLIALGSLLARFWLWIWLFLVRGVGFLSRDLERTVNVIVPVDQAQASIGNDDNHEELLRFPLSFLLFLTLFWVIFSAALFNWWLEHQWSFSESLYFIMISFMTIGLGDYIPSKYDHGAIMMGFLLLGGLALISTLITILQKQIGAVAASMKEYIDKEYVQEISNFLNGITEISVVEEQKSMPSADSQTNIRTKSINSINVVVKRMAWRRRAAYNMMSREKKKQLEEYLQMKLRKVNRGVQTEPFLLESRRYSLAVTGMREIRNALNKIDE